jgi:hypothetical protein
MSGLAAETANEVVQKALVNIPMAPRAEGE